MAPLQNKNCKNSTTTQHKTTRGKVRNKTFNNTTEQDLGLITEISVVLQCNVLSNRLWYLVCTLKKF